MISEPRQRFQPAEDQEVAASAGSYFLVSKKSIDFFSDGLEIIQSQVHNCVSDVSNLIQVLEASDNQIANHPGGHFRLAHITQCSLDLSSETINVCGRNWPFGTGNPYPLDQFFPVKLLAGSILFDQ
jgi:hypothetical protein